jgi:molybdate transport system ATP-binding protein
MGAVLDTRLAAHRDDVGLSVLVFEGGTLTVARLAKPVGAQLRARVRAEDIMLALEEPKQISANNVLPVRIAAIGDAGATHADVQLLCGATRLVARITRASVQRMALAAETDAFAIIKAVTVDL